MTRLTELTPEIVHEFIDKIVVSKPENMVRAISLEVVFNIATVLEAEPHVSFKFNPDK